MNIKEIKDQIKSFALKEVTKCDEVLELQKIVPGLKKIVFGYDWSGFNDGDAEYPICRPLFTREWSSAPVEYAETSHSYEEYFTDFRENDDETWEYIQTLPKEECGDFADKYTGVCEDLFSLLTQYYDVGDTIVVELGESK